MLKERIISTLRFFDLQEYPLTLLELEEFLLSSLSVLRSVIDFQGEIVNDSQVQNKQPKISSFNILQCLEQELTGEVQNTLGFYHLSGRGELVSKRLNNYFYGIEREKLIKKYINGLKYIPFVRGVALAGSQAMGQQKNSSDIDLLIIAQPGFLWLARTLVTAYFQILGKRRHGKKIANRFCLNHYLVGPKKITSLRNFYTAAEYIKLRPLVYGQTIWQFQKQNESWIKTFFPNVNFIEPGPSTQKDFQIFLEKLFLGKFGRFLEIKLKNWQLPKIGMEKFIVVEADELSFHPDSKQQGLLEKFFT